MRAHLPLLAVFVLLSGCPWIGTPLEAERLDPDGDGVPWPDDCDDADPALAVPGVAFADADGDGLGDPDGRERLCGLPTGFVTNADDCDDGDPAVGLPTEWVADRDRDGFANPADTLHACAPPDDGWLAAGAAVDCDDGDELVHPAAVELCNDGIDNDCDGGPGDCALAGEYDLFGALPSGGVIYDGAPWAYLGAALAIGDATGDGQADLVLGSPMESGVGSLGGSVRVIEGPIAAGPPVSAAAVSARTLYADALSYGVGASVALPGDTNGWGPAVVLGAPWTLTGGYWYYYYYTSYPGGAVAVYADPGSDLPTTTIAGYSAWGSAGIGVVGLGDVDGNGLADFAYAVPGSPNAGVHVVLGPVQQGWFAHGDYPVSLVIEPGPATGWIGEALAAGDTDGDGRAELYIGDPWNDPAQVYQANPAVTGRVATSDGPSVGEPTPDPYDFAGFGFSLAVSGDVNGDGFHDLVVAAPWADRDGLLDAGTVWLFRGGPAGALADPAPVAVSGTANWMLLGSAVASAGDLDGDGLADVLVQFVQGDLPGGVTVIYGSRGTWGERTATFSGLQSWVARAGLGSGDLNGDGVGDLVLAAPYGPSNENGRVHVIFGLGL